MNKVLKIIGFLLIAGGLLLMVSIYGPVLKEEIRYQTYSPPPISEIIPVSKEFGLVIPKIGINTKVFANVDDQNPSQYLPLLTKGVAHAKGSGLPGQNTNVFIFGHSTDTPLNAARYNAVFYLINKLQAGDEILVFYQGEKFVYQVVGKKVVSPGDVSQVLDNLSGKTIVLQTCTPPGTTFKRLLVIGKETDWLKKCQLTVKTWQIMI